MNINILPISFKWRWPIFPVLAFVLCLQATHSSAGTLLKMDFADRKAEEIFHESWNLVSGREPVLEAGKGLLLSDSVVSSTLAKPAPQEFSLQVELLHSEYERGQWFGLFTGDFQRGVVVVWDSSHAEDWDSAGFACIYAVDIQTGKKPTYMLISNGEGVERMLTPQGLAEKGGEGGQKAVTEPFAKFRLTWNRADGRLELLLGESSVGVAFLDQVDDFTEVVLSGMGRGIYRSVELSGK